MIKELDPLPYRTNHGRMPWGYIGQGRERVAWSPREEYEQDQFVYMILAGEFT